MPGRRERPPWLVEMTATALMMLIMMMTMVVAVNSFSASLSSGNTVAAAVVTTSVAKNGSGDSCFGLPDNTTEIKGNVEVQSGTKISCTGNLRILSNSSLRWDG